MAKLGLYIFHPDGYFRARNKYTEADLPQPVGGEARCYIAAASVDMEPLPYRSRNDLHEVIASEFAATGQDLPVGEWVEYYSDTWASYTNRVSELKRSLTEIAARGVGLDRMFSEAA